MSMAQAAAMAASSAAVSGCVPPARLRLDRRPSTRSLAPVASTTWPSRTNTARPSFSARCAATSGLSPARL